MTSAHKWYLQFVKKKINYHVFITIKQKYFGLVLENFEEKKIEMKSGTKKKKKNNIYIYIYSKLINYFYMFPQIHFT